MKPAIHLDLQTVNLFTPFYLNSSFVFVSFIESVNMDKSSMILWEFMIKSLKTVIICTHVKLGCITALMSHNQEIALKTEKLLIS